MTNVEGSTSIVFFHDRPSALESARAELDAEDHPVEYLMARERAERAAAKSAQSLKARHLHQELAQFYASKIRHSGQR